MKSISTISIHSCITLILLWATGTSPVETRPRYDCAIVSGKRTDFYPLPLLLITRYLILHCSPN
nr:MAG TPA: hypothetical protein [Caudoviricetes sp.]